MFKRYRCSAVFASKVCHNAKVESKTIITNVAILSILYLSRLVHNIWHVWQILKGDEGVLQETGG